MLSQEGAKEEGPVIDYLKDVVSNTKKAVSDKMITNAQEKMNKMEKRVEWMMDQNTKMQGVVRAAADKVIAAKNELDALPSA